MNRFGRSAVLAGAALLALVAAIAASATTAKSDRSTAPTAGAAVTNYVSYVHGKRGKADPKKSKVYIGKGPDKETVVIEASTSESPQRHDRLKDRLAERHNVTF